MDCFRLILKYITAVVEGMPYRRLFQKTLGPQGNKSNTVFSHMSFLLHLTKKKVRQKFKKNMYCVLPLLPPCSHRILYAAFLFCFEIIDTEGTEVFIQISNLCSLHFDADQVENKFSNCFSTFPVYLFLTLGLSLHLPKVENMDYLSPRASPEVQMDARRHEHDVSFFF